MAKTVEVIINMANNLLYKWQFSSGVCSEKKYEKEIEIIEERLIRDW